MPSATQLYNTGKMLNAADLANNPNIGLNKRVPAIIHHVQPELIGQGSDQKTMLMAELVSKQGQAWPKKLPFNKSNTMQMVSAFGDDYDRWVGKAIEIWAENVMFSGKMVPGIKVAAAPNGTTSVPANQPSSATAVAGIPGAAAPTWNPPRSTNAAPIDDDLNDTIPF